jgi:ubiquinone/menaquinone biosynthesis C-methylase UbiE
MSENIDNGNKVHEAYNKYADKIIENGYRFNPVYIATKALSDWFLMTGIDLKGKQVLNIGCAEPIDEMQFVEKVAKWVALDINENLIKTAEEIARRKLSPSLFNKLQFVRDDATSMSFPDGTFDVVVSFSVIEHIPGIQERQKVFNEISRVLKPGGLAVVTVPNKISTFFFAHNKSEKLKTSDYGYAHLYTRGELKKSLLTAGLKPTVFASEYSALMSLPSRLPEPLVIFLSLFQRFGERMGFLAIKAESHE